MTKDNQKKQEAFSEKKRFAVKAGIALLFVLLLSAAPALADDSDSVPLLPMQFYGTAFYDNGTALPAGTTIAASLGGETFVYTLTEDGTIGGISSTWDVKFLVSGDVYGDTIIFSSIGADGVVNAIESVVYEPGAVYELTLTFPSVETDVTEYGAWVSTDTVSVRDVFYLNITGKANDVVCVYISSEKLSILPNLPYADTTSASNGYNITLDESGKRSVPFTAERYGYAQFDVWWISENDAVSVSVNITAAVDGYLRIDAPKGLSLDIESEWVNAYYFDAYGNKYQEYVTWNIDDKSVIGLSRMGVNDILLTPRSAGTAVLYAELSDNPLVNASVELVVEETRIVGVVGQCDEYLSLGTTMNAWGYAVDQFGNHFPSDDLQWSISGGNISLTTDSNDNHMVIVTPIYVGEETITLRSLSTGLSWSQTVTVTTGTTNPNAGDPDHLWCWIENPSLTVDAEPGHAHAYVDDRHGNTLYDELMVWEIDNESVAVISVDNDINDATHSVTITPKRPGYANLTVYAKNHPELFTTWSILVEDTVVSSVSGPHFPEKISLSDSGHSSRVYVYDQFGNQLPNEYATVTVSDKSVLQLRSQSSIGSMLQVQNDNYVSTQPVSTGTVTITTTAVSNFSAVWNTTVTVEDSEVALISLEDHNYGITTQSHPSFYAEVQDYYGNYLHHQNLVWTIDNESVLYISDEWDNSITCQPLAPGTATIRVALDKDRTIYDEITVTVEETVLSSVKIDGRMEMSTISEGYAYAYVCDQYGEILPEEAISWSVDDPGIVEIEEYVSSYNRQVNLIPKALGSTTLRAYSVSDPTLTWNHTVTVCEPEITEFRLSYPSLTVPMNSLGYISAEMWDQFGRYCSDAELFWSVDNDSVLELSSSLSKARYHLLLIPQMPGVVNLTVSPVACPEYSETVQIMVSGGPVVYEYQIETAESYPLGAPIHLSGNVTSYETVWFYIEGPNTTLTELSDWGIGVQNDGSWEFTLSGSDLAVDLEVGTYTIYAVSGGLDLWDDNPFAGKYYGKAMITITPLVLDVNVPEYISVGTNVLINGTTMESASVIQAYVFGVNLFQKLPVVTSDVNGTFLVNLSTAEFAAGQYYLLVHHPMSDGYFNIDVDDNAGVYVNTDGPAVVNGVGVGNKVFNIYDRQPTNAVQTFCDVIDKYGLDDAYSLTSFLVYEGEIPEEPVPPEEPDAWINLYGKSVVPLNATGNVWVNSYSGEYNETFVWSVDNTSVLELVNSWGSDWERDILPLAEGTANITVALADNLEINATMTIIVVPELTITGIEMDSKSLFMTTAQPGYLYVQTIDQFGSYLSWNDVDSFCQMIEVTSSNTSVLTVTPTEYPGEYLLTPVSVGEAVIYADCTYDANITASVWATVNDPSFTISLTCYDEGLTAGAEGHLYASVSDQYGTWIASHTKEFIWNVSNPELLRLETTESTNEMRMVGLGPGIVTITAAWKEDPSYIAEYTVEIEKAVHNFISAWGQERLTTASENAYVIAVLYDQYGHRLVEEPVAATVVNKSVVSVALDPEDSTRYYLTPLAVGATEIVFSVKDSSVPPEVMKVTVAEPVPQLHAYPYPGEYLSLSAESFVAARAMDQYDHVLNSSLYPIIWNVSNHSVLEYEEFTYGDETLLHITPLMEGTAVIHASLANGETADPIEITVKGETEVSAVDVGIFGENEEISNAAVYGADGQSTFGSMAGYKLYLDETLFMGEAYDAGVVVYDQYGNFIDTAAVKLSANNPDLLYWMEEETADQLGPLPYYPFTLVPQQAGTVILTAASTVNPSVSDSITLKVAGNDTAPIIPGGEAEVIVPPVITPDGKTLYHDSETITITTETEGAVIYYTTDGSTPDENSTLYTGPFTLEYQKHFHGHKKSQIVKAIAVKEGCENSKVVTAIYKHHRQEKPYHHVRAAPVTGGSVIVDVSDEGTQADTFVNVTFQNETGYVLAGWSILGDISGDHSNKSSDINGFAMWNENVTIIPEFIEIVDPTPRPAAVKIQHVPSKIYEDDTGALNAIVYDQYGDRLAENAVTWNSSATAVFAINKETGVYEARNGGIAVVTATSTDDTNISASVTISVYTPPLPLVSGLVSGPETAYYGVMSDPFVVTTQHTSHLNWDFDDGTPVVKTEVSTPYPGHTTSRDSVSHTFVEVGELTVELTPSNSYREGETKTFTVDVTYAPPRNLVITEGPSAVVGGESATYKAFATGADNYVWYLDGKVVDGQNSAVATITFPANTAETTSTVAVTANYMGGEYCTQVTKTVTVSVAGGVLGEFGDDITMNPAKPAVGDVVTFTIAPVSNAVEYLWAFEDGTTETTTAPNVKHSLADTTTDSVTVTAKNSAGLSKEKTYTFTAAGVKPAKPVITASPASPAQVGVTTTFSVEEQDSVTYKWRVSGGSIQSETNTGSSIKVLWTEDDVATHQIDVQVTNDYGTAKAGIGYEVKPKQGKPAVLSWIEGSEKNQKGKHVVLEVKVQTNDRYTITWYLDGQPVFDGSGNHNKHKHEKDMHRVILHHQPLTVGEHMVKVVVTTEYGETSELTKQFFVLEDKDWNANNKDKNRAHPDEHDKVTPRMTESSVSGKSALSTVGSLTLDKDDLSEDAEDVSIDIAPIDPSDLHGFTDEMGSRNDVLMSLEINPTGLKNEKDLQKSALITFRLLKADVADPASIQFYRLDTGSDDGIDQWVRLHKEGYTEDGDFYEFTVATAGMSQFVAAATGDITSTPSIETTEIKNTTASWNAATAAEVGYQLSAGNLGTIRAPEITNGGVSLTLSEKVVVKKYVGGVATTVSATVLADGSVSVDGPDLSDAEYLEVSFVGRKLGDVTGEGNVDTLDAATVLQSVVNLYTFTSADTFYGDVSGDGLTNTLDASMLLQYSVKLVDDNYVTKT